MGFNSENFKQQAHEKIIDLFNLTPADSIEISTMKLVYNRFIQNNSDRPVDIDSVFNRAVNHFALRYTVLNDHGHHIRALSGNQSDALLLAVICGDMLVKTTKPEDFPDNKGQITSTTIESALEIMREACSVRKLAVLRHSFKAVAANDIVSQAGSFFAHTVLFENVHRIEGMKNPSYSDLVNFLQYDLYPASEYLDPKIVIGKQLCDAVAIMEPAVVDDLIATPMNFY